MKRNLFYDKVDDVHMKKNINGVKEGNKAEETYSYLLPRMLWSSIMRAASCGEKLPRFKSGLR